MRPIPSASEPDATAGPGIGSANARGLVVGYLAGFSAKTHSPKLLGSSKRRIPGLADQTDVSR